MNPRYPRMLGAAAFCIYCLMATATGRPTAADIVIRDPWTRATAAGMPMGAGYLLLENLGSQADELIGAESPVAGHVEIHRTTIRQGIAAMRPVARLLIGPRVTVRAAPGGLHLMLVDLRTPLREGASVPLTLHFQRAGTLQTQLLVRSMGAAEPLR